MDNEDTDPNMNENKDYIDLQLVHGFSQSMKSLFTGLADATKQTQQKNNKKNNCNKYY